MDKTGDLDCQSQLEAQLGQPVYLLHRLDRPVGGVVVFAKTAQAAAALNQQMQQRLVEKTYLAVAEGNTAPQQTLVDYLRKDGRSNLSQVVSKEAKGAKEARLSYETKQQVTWEGHLLSLVEVRLQTGRHHQIRVQFASRNWPLYGDGKYGAARRRGQKGFGLFSHEISFTHPQTGQWMTFTAKPQGEPFTFFLQGGGKTIGKTEEMS